jgi:GNAT superfamily N-acetyltransferase
MREINPNETEKLYDCLEALAKHHNQVSAFFKGDYPQIPSEQKIVQFGKELAEGRSRIAVIENEHKVIGFCKINTDGSRGIVEYLVVLDQERGKGYGAAFMDWALNAFRKLGINEIDVKAVYGNEAIRFYEKYGFRERSVILTLKR